MSKRRPTDAQLAEMLTQPHFGQRRAEIAPQDPITATPMIVEIDRIDYYDRNPRRAPNDKYQEIKASIAAGEMDQPLTITRRPGAARYMVFKGGNTRLRALKELYSETGEERFQRIHCLFQPWTRESDALLGHLKENDLRGDLVFIDRALAIRELKKLLEEETGEQLSQRQLSTALKERGYSLSQALLVWLDYAVNVLHQAIPTALSAGMGRPQIERIKALDRAFEQCWKSLGLGGDDMAQSVFIVVLSRHDAEQLDLDAVRRDLETELSVTVDIDVQRASLLMGAALDGRTLTNGPTFANPSDEGEGGQPQERNQEVELNAPIDSTESRCPPALPQSHEETEEHAQKAPNPKRSPADTKKTEPPLPSTAISPTPPSVPMTAPTENLPALRTRAAKLALDIAVLARMGGEQIVHPIPAGTGYLIGPVPQEVIAATERQLGPDHISHLRYLWWILAGISEQFSQGSRASDYLPEAWRNRPFEEALQYAGGELDFTRWHLAAADLFETDPQRADAMWQEMPPVAINYLGAMLWPRMHDWAWEMFVELVGVYRAIHKASKGKVWG